MNWREWAESVFGTPFDIWHDGLAVERFDRLTGADREAALALLPEGLVAGDHVAAVGVRRLEATDLLPELVRALPGAGGKFLAEVAHALQALGGDADAARARIFDLIRSEPVWSHRMDLAIGLRSVPGPGVTDVLLSVVERDQEYLVRYHAAESLLAIAGREPLRLSDHGDLFGNVAAEEEERHVAAASTLRSMLTAADPDA